MVDSKEEMRVYSVLRAAFPSAQRGTQKPWMNSSGTISRSRER